MESFVGLSPSDYENPAAALEKFWSRIFLASPQNALAFFVQLCMYLGDTGRHQHAAALLELDVGLQSGDYSDRDLIRKRFQERLHEAPAEIAILYRTCLANVLSLLDRVGDELAVLEVLLDLAPGDYSEPERLARRLSNIPEVMIELTVPNLLVASLQKSSRMSESICVLAAIVGIDPRDLGDPEALHEGVQDYLRGEVTFAKQMLLMLMFRSLLEAGRGTEGLNLFEASLDLRREDYRNVHILAQKIQKSLESVPPEMAVVMILSFLMALTRQNRGADAVEVFRAFEGLDSSVFDDPKSLTAHLKERARFLPVSFSGFYFAAITTTLALAGLPQAAVAAMEADAELEALDWQDPARLAEVFKLRLGGMTGLAEVLYLSSLVTALLMADKEKRAALLVDAYFRGMTPLDHREPALAPAIGILAQNWLEWWGRDPQRQPMEVCAAMVCYLRRSLLAHGVTLQDRERFIREAGELRRRIVQTGLYWAAREADPARADDLRRTVLLWDLELAQRLLVERFLLTEIRAVPAGEPPVIDTWPLPDQEQPLALGYLPETSEALAAAGVLGKADFL